MGTRPWSPESVHLARRDAAWFTWEAKQILRRIRPCDAVLELGAAGGALTVQLAAHAAWVTAVEPALDQVSVLGQTLCMANAYNVAVTSELPEGLAIEPHDVVVVVDRRWPASGLEADLTRLCRLGSRQFIFTGWRQVGDGAASRSESGAMSCGPRPKTCRISRLHRALGQLGFEPEFEQLPVRLDRARTVLAASRT